MPYQPLNVQCFVKKTFEPIFVGNNTPKLLYVAEIQPHASVHPRILHAHEDFVEIILIVSGSSEYLIHDKKQTIQAGDLLVYNAGVVHDEVSGPDNEIGSYCVAVSGLHMPHLRENALLPEGAGYVFSTGEQFESIHSVCRMMFQYLSSGAAGAEAICSSLMHALLLQVLSVTAQQITAPAEDTEPDDLGKQMKEYIDQNYMRQITLQSIADALHFSPYYLAHVFKKMTGYSPMQYLLRRRIGEAQSLLISTDLPIGRVAEMVGYETQSYFNLQFSKHVGMSPKRFRKNYVVSAE